jgi:hypothetical protein
VASGADVRIPVEIVDRCLLAEVVSSMSGRKETAWFGRSLSVPGGAIQATSIVQISCSLFLCNN